MTYRINFATVTDGWFWWDFGFKVQVLFSLEPMRAERKKRNFQIKFMSLVLVHETEGFRTLQTTLKIQRKLRKHFLPSRKLAPKSCFNFFIWRNHNKSCHLQNPTDKMNRKFKKHSKKKSWNFEKLYRI